MFNIGDKVIYRKGWGGNRGDYAFGGVAQLAGEMATIIDVGNDLGNSQCYLLQFEGNRRYHAYNLDGSWCGYPNADGGWWVTNTEITKVEPKKEFKVGDVVIVGKPHPNTTNVGVIVGSFEQNGRVFYRYNPRTIKEEIISEEWLKALNPQTAGEEVENA